MQGIEATFDDGSFDEGHDFRKVPVQLVLGAAALVTVGCVAAYVLHARLNAAPDLAKAPPAVGRTPASAGAPPVNLYGEMIIEPGWLPKAGDQPSVASLEPLPALVAPQAAPSAPAVEAPPPAATLEAPEAVPLPPTRDVARLEDTAPLPPPRPPEFGAARPLPERRVALPSSAQASTSVPGDNRNILQKLLGLGQPSGTVASLPPQSRPSTPPAVASVPPTVAPAPSAASSGRGGFAGLFPAFSRAPNLDRLGYDRYTAVYDISARVVYLPDGTRLEAHSGLGNLLDDPRYVNERARGATPPHLYELTMRESLFHGVQALRLNPVGEGGLYGRAGLLAHPYMLGPNGDSNGCVSVKEYDAFLRAYQNGEIKKLAVVAQL